ncbi:MAG TPA: TrkA C-terminal domain-containing protein [Stenomitos sp.]
MLTTIRDLLAQNQLALLFLTVGGGYLVSKVRIKGFSLGVASILFVGLGLGAWGGKAFGLPEFVSQFGLLLFVYAIGLQTGPAFFRILRRRGLGITALGLLSVLVAGAIAWLASKLLHIDPALAVGLYCGGTFNVPALAAATEMLRGTPHVALPTIGYSVSSPLAVVIPILVAEAAARLCRVDIPEATKQAEEAAGGFSEPPTARNYRVTSPALIGHLLDDSPLRTMPLCVSRLQRGEHVMVARHDMVLEAGDILRLVGTMADLSQAERIIGPEVAGPGPEARRDEVDFRRMILSNPELIGKRLEELDLEAQWGAVVTRLRRGDVDFVPGSQTLLERGDRLRVVAPSDKLDALSKYLGDSFRGLSETDFISLSLGILVGLGLGAIPIVLPGGLTLKLGLAGGPLLAALFLGWRGRTGPIIWSLPLAVNLAFRQLGLVLFFAAVGLHAGQFFGPALASQGPLLVAVGATITFVSSLVLLIGAMGLLKSDWVTATGLLAGGQTQPALLVFVGERSHSEAPNTAYTSIFPTAMIAKILLAQILVGLFGL